MSHNPLGFFMMLISQIPWLAIAVVAAVVFFRGGKALTAIIQAIAACGIATLAVAREIIWYLLRWMDVGYSWYQAITYIFWFLILVLMCIFAAAYAVDKLKKNNKAIQGFPVA